MNQKVKFIVENLGFETMITQFIVVSIISSILGTTGSLPIKIIAVLTFIALIAECIFYVHKVDSSKHLTPSEKSSDRPEYESRIPVAVVLAFMQLVFALNILINGVGGVHTI